MISSLRKTRMNFAQKLAILLMMCILAVPTSYLFAPKAEAIFGNTVTVIGNVAPTEIESVIFGTLNKISNVASSLSLETLAFKETTLDSIAYMAAKTFLHAVVRSTINWINSGFQGAPAFVTDLNGFLLSVADETVGQFIYDSDALNFLCSPFQLDIKIALAAQYSKGRQGNYQPQCTLSQVAGNVDNFLKGSFNEGGWPGFLELTISEESNPTMAYFNAQTEMYARIVNAQGEEIKKLDFGNGFFSMEICDVAEHDSGAKPNCVIGTPGSVIAKSINDALAYGQQELISADEINEVFNALFAQLANKAFTGAYGLLGLGGNSNYTEHAYGSTGTGSFLDAIGEEDLELAANADWIIGDVKQTLATEKSYAEAQLKVYNKLTDLLNSYSFSTSSATTTGSASSASGGTCTADKVPSDLINLGNTTETEINNTLANISFLEGIVDRLENGDASERQTAINQYQQLNGASMFHTETDIGEVDLFVKLELDDFIDAWKATLKARGC